MSNKEELIASLREFADWLENDPKSDNVPLPYKIYVQQYVYEYAKKLDENGNPVFYDDGTPEYDYSKVDEFETRTRMREIAKSLAPCKKDYTDSSFELERMFGKRLEYSVKTSREAVCEKKVVGTRVIPARTVEEHTEEIVEWVCNDSLLRPDNT